MLQSDMTEQKEFINFDETIDFISSRIYQDMVITSNEIVLKEDKSNIVGQDFAMFETFVEALFSLTKLPRKNEVVLPNHNVVTDINTLLTSNNESVGVRFLNNKIYTLFKNGNKGIKKPLNHLQFLETIREVIDVEKVKKITLIKNFLRITFIEGTPIESPLDHSDDFQLGYDIINGEILKTYPLTFGMYFYRPASDNGIILPLIGGYLKIQPSYNDEALRNRLISKLKTSYNVERLIELNKERLVRTQTTALKDEMVKYFYSGLKCLPVESRENVFSKYFEMGQDGKMNNRLKPDALEGKTIHTFILEVLDEMKNNPEIDPLNKYKTELFLGNLYNENNDKLNTAML